MRILLYRLLLIVLALAPLAARAQPSQRGDGAEDLMAAVQQMSRLVGEAQELHDKADAYARCRRLLEPRLEEAIQAYRHIDEPYPWLLLVCRFGDTGDGRPRGTEAEMRGFMAPWLVTLQRQGQADPLLAIRWAWAYRHYLRVAGLKEEAEQVAQHEVRERVARLRDAPDDSLAQAELTFVAQSLFGAWPLQDEVRRLHALFEEGLGPAHRLSLSILRSLAYHDRFLGRPQHALSQIERAVTLTHEHHSSDQLLAAHMATEHAACLASAGRPAEARARMLDARATFASQRPLPHVNLARIDTNLAGISLDLGDFDAAVDHAGNAIEHARLSGLPVMQVEARVPRATREVARLLQGRADAASKLRDVLAEMDTGEMHIGPQAFALVQHAAKTGDAELLDWAGGVADLHIRRFRTPMQPDSALRPLMQAWREGGYALLQAGARAPLDRAFAISLTGRSPGTLALTQFNLARHLSATDPDTAVWLYKRGANALQQLRSGLPTSELELHRAWLGAHEADLRAFIGLLIDQGRLVEAEQAITVLRDEESHEYSRRAPNRSAGAGGGNTSTQQLSYTAGEALRNVALDTAARRAEEAAQRADAKVDARSNFVVLTTYTDAQAQADIDGLSSLVHRLVDEPPALRGGPPARHDISARPLRARTARLTYFVRDDGMDIVLQLGRTRVRYAAAVSRTDLNRTILSARSALNTPQTDALPALQLLHRWMLAPLEPHLRRGDVRELQWVPDAALRYVPFGALHDGQQFAAQRYVITTRWAGSARLEDAEISHRDPRRPRALGVLGMGRTVGDANHSALPGVRQEIENLREAGAQVWLDEDFTEQRLREGLRRGPAVVHLASHFALDPAGEEKSFLLLGDGKHLSLSALAGLPWHGVNLALLSACDSALALDSGPGRAMVGLASTLQAAGVNRVLATLWRVADGATARWMEMFYAKAGLAAPGSGVARLDATRAARTQREWLRRFAGTPLAHPHYWAGFSWITRE